MPNLAPMGGTGAPSATLTAFVREVLLPGGPGAVPRIDAAACRFALSWASSPIHRWGLFADEPIPKRRHVIEYTGQRIGREEAHRRRIRPNIYLYWIRADCAIDGAIGGSGAEYINHSCDPNLIARVRHGRIMLVSLRRIRAGDELLVDYRIDGGGALYPCRCGSAICRGYMNRYPPEDAVRLSPTHECPNESRARARDRIRDDGEVSPVAAIAYVPRP